MTKLCLALAIAAFYISFTNTSLEAQQLAHRQGELIICFHSNTNIDETIEKYSTFKQRSIALKANKCLSQDMNIWKLSYKHERINENELVDALTAEEEVVVAQLNHFIKKRELVPNDPLLGEQWHWLNLGDRGLVDADIDADEAWSLSTGGVTALGDTVVVAVLDVGVDYMHPDLADNIWTNQGEIAGNQIDDDGNGYIDDKRGWNVLLENDNIDPEQFAGGAFETHGTEILGILGARGNNGFGVAGINWRTKIMNVFINNDLNEADMIAGYGYVLAQRKLYNETNGNRGAFVVATNLSYGDEDLNPEETPIWCAVYDSLGAAGIINCTATANESIDIDSIKDVPTSCVSDYMISVTATNESDERDFAAYGKQDIDLAAPGSQVFTTSIPGYAHVTGTSFAAPMVAGAIGLLYSSPCSDLASMAKVDPAGAALRARSLVLDHVDKLEGLAEDVSTGGRLNVFNALNQTLIECSSCIAPFELVAEVDQDSLHADISWMTADSVAFSNFSWRVAGDTIWTMIDSAMSPLRIEGLRNCTSYEYQIQATCLDASNAISAVESFSTTDCCRATGIVAVPVSGSQTQLQWVSGPEAEGYMITYGRVTDTFALDTLILEQSSESVTLDGLTPCTDYWLLLESMCSDSAGMQGSDTIQFESLGCGPCRDLTYCPLDVNAVGDEWIESVLLNTIENISGYDDGYGDHTGNSTQLKQGNSYDIDITPGFAGDATAEYFFGWIDFNQDGIFTNEDERVFDSDSAVEGSVYKGRIVIPDNARTGITRMRLLMLFEPLDDTVSACNTVIDLGEAEDYCVEIVIDSLLCPQPQNIDTANFMGTSTEIVWENVDSSLAYIIRHRKVGESEWMEEVDTMPSFSLMELDDCSDYEVQIEAVCARDTSGFTESFVFSTFCDTGLEDELLNISASVFPNPFSEFLTVQLDSDIYREVQLEIYDVRGERLSSQSLEINEGHQRLLLDQMGALPSGMYLLSLQARDGRLVRKIFKQ